MAITGFIITELPDPTKVLMTISGSPVLLNQVYPIADESNLICTRVDGNNTVPINPLDTFKYKVTNGVEESNEATVSLVFRPTLGSRPTIVGVSLNAPNNDPIPLADLIDSYSSTTDRFKFIQWYSGSFGPFIGQFKRSDGSPIVLNEEIFISEINDISYYPLPTGGGNPYLTATMAAGNSFGYNLDLAGLGNIIVRILSLATISGVTQPLDTSIQSLTVNGVQGSYEVVSQETIVSVLNGLSGKNVKLRITIASPFLALNDVNTIGFSIGIDEYEKQSDEIFELDYQLDPTGEIIFTTTLFAARDTTAPIESNVTIEILEVDGSPSNVDTGNNTLIINTNIT